CSHRGFFFVHGVSARRRKAIAVAPFDRQDFLNVSNGSARGCGTKPEVEVRDEAHVWVKAAEPVKQSPPPEHGRLEQRSVQRETRPIKWRIQPQGMDARVLVKRHTVAIDEV